VSVFLQINLRQNVRTLKKRFAEMSKNLARYRSENNFVGLPN